MVVDGAEAYASPGRGFCLEDIAVNPKTISESSTAMGPTVAEDSGGSRLFTVPATGSCAMMSGNCLF